MRRRRWSSAVATIQQAGLCVIVGLYGRQTRERRRLLCGARGFCGQRERELCVNGTYVVSFSCWRTGRRKPAKQSSRGTRKNRTTTRTREGTSASEESSGLEIKEAASDFDGRIPKRRWHRVRFLRWAGVPAVEDVVSVPAGLRGAVRQTCRLCLCGCLSVCFASRRRTREKCLDEDVVTFRASCLGSRAGVVGADKLAAVCIASGEGARAKGA